MAELYGDVESAPSHLASPLHGTTDHLSPLPSPISQSPEQSSFLSSGPSSGYSVYQNDIPHLYSPQARISKEVLRDYIQRDPPKEGEDIQIITSKWLRHIGCYFHKRLRTIICCTCKTGIKSDHILAHIKKHNLTHAITQSSLPYVIKYYNILPYKEVGKPKYKTVIPFLPVLSGLGCIYPNCTYACGTQSSMDKHYSTHRSNLPLQFQDPSLPRYREIKMQTVFTSPKIFFEVIPPALPTTTAYEQWMEEMKDIPETLFSPRGTYVSHSGASEDITPFLLFTQWHIHLAEQRNDRAKGEALFKAAAKPSILSPFEDLLWKTALKYLKHVGTLISAAPHNARRLLLQWPLYVCIQF